ncbi:hypothetical protein, partial [Paenibacillus sp. 7541]
GEQPNKLVIDSSIASLFFVFPFGIKLFVNLMFAVMKSILPASAGHPDRFNALHAGHTKAALPSGPNIPHRMVFCICTAFN